jgi:osmotically-inducible protein OsmY
MAEPTTATTRPDIDIHDDVNDIIARYPPLAADRHQLRILVTDGVVHLAGHVKSQPSRRYLVDSIPQIDGVQGVNDRALYDEDTIRIEVGQVIPVGILATMRYGTVILSGKLPDGVTVDDLVSRLAQIPGVERVATNF